ncbi:hypothetical protein HK097_004829 [Rhizophlyctis rosea]|uniref:peptidylprolyl isomerase n=1 Tax=Rhizophlyctis rosea TaxID=64517 RepID=A0AAD5WZV2_9FUNG|nr:hypothetical protein HK097_004829 [Rhizophlyctis rosea]
MGVTKTIIKPGDGQNFPKKGDTVTMHYDGTFTNGGGKFDSSYDRGSPFVTKIGVGQVIKGWDEGVPQMSLGEKAKLDITYDYAYGERGHPAGVSDRFGFLINMLERVRAERVKLIAHPPVQIPPKADLTFVVELLKIN